MRGVVLAGGTGSRLGALTTGANKHLLRVNDRPMIEYAIEQLVGAGVDRITLVTGVAHLPAFRAEIGDGASLGVRELAYAGQERPGGIAQALALAEPTAAGEPLTVLLGDNIFERSIAEHVQRFAARPRGAVVVLARVEDPTGLGVALMRDGRLVDIVEKPVERVSDLAVTGLYLYDTRAFGLIRELAPSARGELEITDLNRRYLALGELRHETIDGYWIDCGGSPEMLKRAGRLVAERGANTPAA